MKQPLDKIYDAYYDGMGTTFGRKVRERIHWICREAKGNKILDVGCSQGIAGILLAREGKQVLGLDLLQESIEYANSQLENEEDEVNRLVKFIQGNFITYDIKESKYDAVLLTEVLEHLNQPEEFIKKSHDLLVKGGKLIVTVPFGINDYFDHKKTYYLLSLIEEVHTLFCIEKIEFLGKWIGVVGIKRDPLPDIIENYEFSNELIGRLELAFNNIERELLNEINKGKEKIINLESKLKEKNLIEEEYRKLQVELKSIKEEKIESMEKVNNERKLLLSQIEVLKTGHNNLENQIDSLLNEFQKLYMNEEKDSTVPISQYEIIKQELSTSIEDLVNHIDTEKKYLELLKQQKNNINILKGKEDNYINKIKILEKQVDKLNKKYNALKFSKLGKITTIYWKIRKKLSNK